VAALAFLTDHPLSRNHLRMKGRAVRPQHRTTGGQFSEKAPNLAIRIYRKIRGLWGAARYAWQRWRDKQYWD